MLNDIAVSLFGSILSASFCSVLSRPRRRRIFLGCMALLPLIQGWVCVRFDAVFLQHIYPFVVHLPLVLVLYILTGELLWPAISVLSAYLCCQLRRWIGLLVTALLNGGDMMQDVIELIVTVPLLLLLLYFISPAVLQLSDSPVKTKLQYGFIPAVYYGFDYLTRVYTKLLQSGNLAVVEFMPFVCCAAYLAFLLYHSVSEQKQIRLQKVQQSLDLQVAQAVREIDILRESQALAQQHRHDLRHHMQYLSACIKNGRTKQALAYISEICEEIDAQKVTRYCENESVNLILSSFAGRAEKEGIRMQVQGALPASVQVSDSDLCAIFSNALENAIHACQPIAASGGSCVIDVWFYERAQKLFLQMTNPCSGDVHFRDGIPTTDRPGHGIGVQSICAIVNRYGGLYTFLIQDGNFILRLSF